MIANKRKKKSSLRRSIFNAPRSITPEQELTFQAMRARAIDREKYGPSVETSRYHIVILACILVYGVSTVVTPSDTDRDKNTPPPQSTSTTNTPISAPISIIDDDLQYNNSKWLIRLTVTQAITIFIMVLVFALISMVIPNRLKTPFYLIMLYIPLVHAFVLISVKEDLDGHQADTIWLSLGICEAIVMFYLICREILYPIFIKSKWVRKNIGVANLWSVQIIAPWTMAYRGKLARWGGIYTCKYDGEEDENGLPHGTGRWFDDIYGGEILSGRWEEGVPVAPFVSRTYGQGDGFAALQIAVFVARDDNFDQSSGTPSNENPPKIGVATVECSVNGNFYSHLPLAKEGKPMLVCSEENSVADICKKIVHLEVDESELENVEIRVDASRRLEVRGHVYTPRTETLRSHSDSDQIIVDVLRHSKNSSEALTRKSHFMARVVAKRGKFDPRGSSIPQNDYMIIEDTFGDTPNSKPQVYNTIEEDNSQEDDTHLFGTVSQEKGLNKHRDEKKCDLESYEEPVVESEEAALESLTSISEFEEDNNIKEDEGGLRMPNAKRLQMKEVQFHISDDESEDSIITEEERGLNMPTDERNHSFNKSLKVAKLEVRDWTRNRLKEALIFFPGFNSSIEKSLKSFGQFLALAQLDRHIYPVLYAWPAGTILSYRAASDISATQKNKDNFTILLRGLSDAGIRTVHIMGHSLGAQSLLAMFEDKHDSNVPSRSDASLMFQHDPAFCDNTDLQGTDEQLMVCKNIILMNPDFPVEAFVDRAFLSIRRVCQNITMLGDRNDIALRAGSKFFNGLYNKKGYMQPHLLRSDKSLKNYTKEFHYLTMGIDIELLYFSEVDGDMNLDQERLDTESGEKKPLINNALLFDSEAPIQATPGESDIEKQWLDIDVIDTTSLDTNIAGVRHGGFSVNPIMIKDLKELIVDGDRARLRSSLLKREGNIHTYSHAPAHVTL